MQTLPALAKYTATFYDWEILGRGWQVYPHLVPLEPPFRPFPGYLPPRGSKDDARRHTILSRLWESLTGNGPTPIGQTEEPYQEVVEELDVPDEAMVEIELLIPPNQKVDEATSLALLLATSFATSTISFELIGTANRVALRLACYPADAESIRARLAALLPDATLNTPNNSLLKLWRKADAAAATVVEFGLAKEFVIPLSDPPRHPDPLAVLVAALAQAGRHEMAVLQVLLEPAAAPWAESAMAALSPDGEPFFVDAPELTKQAERKFSTPLYCVLIRVLTKTRDEAAAESILRGVAGGLSQFSNPQGNALIPMERQDPEECEYNILLRCTDRSGMLLSLSELASIARLPGPNLTTPLLIRELERLPRLPDEAVGHDGPVLGIAQHGTETIQVRLSEDARLQHMYIIGASGTGKSTLLENLIVQDIEAGRGVGLLDPHGDLVDQVLARIPKSRLEDVIVFDPADPEWVVGWNILAAHTEAEKEMLASDLVAVFQRLSTSWGDQMSTVLGNAVLTFLESRTGGTLTDLRKFLLDDTFRKAFLQTVSDEHTASFWRDEFPLLVGRKPQAPILTRLNSFLRSRLVRESVVERDKPLNFRDIIDSKKIFLAKLAQGAIGEENAAFLGSLLMSKFHQVALSRQDTAIERRTPFYLYADEFHNVATPSMATLFSGVRKYKLALCVAHQEMYQLHTTAPELERAILSNAYVRVIFRISEEDAKKLERGMGDFGIEDFINLGRGEAICRVGRRDDAFRFVTLKTEDGDREAAVQRREEARLMSFVRFGRLRSTGAPEAHSLTQPEDSASDSLPGRGGQQHKYLQSLLTRAAEDRGFEVSTEKRVLDGHGHVDVLLERNGLRIGCEISVSTSLKHELGNLLKCLAAGLDYVVLISPEERKLRNAEREFISELTPEQRKVVQFLTPAEFPSWLDAVRLEVFDTTVRETRANARKFEAIRLGAATSDHISEERKHMLAAEQAAAYVRRAPQTLAKLRCIGGGPPYYKIGRNVFYERDDLDAWLDGLKRRSTSDQTISQ